MVSGIIPFAAEILPVTLAGEIFMLLKTTPKCWGLNQQHVYLDQIQFLTYSISGLVKGTVYRNLHS